MTTALLVVDGKQFEMPFNYSDDPNAKMITWVSLDLKKQFFFKSIVWGGESITGQLQQTLDFFLNSGELDKDTILSGFWELT
jgi:hypothetical protein